MHAAPSLSDYSDIQLQRVYTGAFVRLCCFLELESEAGPRSLSGPFTLMHAAERVLAKLPFSVHREMDVRSIVCECG